MKNYDLRLRRKSGEDVLEVIIERDRPVQLCKWRERHQLVQEWLEGRLQSPMLGEVILDIPRILKESRQLSNLDKQNIADWIIDALLPHRLHTRGERVLYETAQALLDVLLPGQPPEQDSKSYQEQLLYTLRRWFALVSDPHRVWFKKESREQAMREALFEDSQGQMRAFYSLPGFPELARDISRWFLIHYDLVTCARIHSALYRIEGGRRPWSRALRWPTRVLYGRSWWILGLISCVLVMLAGVFLPLLGISITSAPTASTLVIVGSLAFSLLYLVLVPPNLRLLRMLGAIGVGYVVLLITGDVWKFAFLIWHDPSRVHAWSILGVSLMASFIYFCWEMGDRVSCWYQRLMRSLLMLGIGLGQSMFVGIGSCLLAGSTFSERAIKIQETLPDYARYQLHFQFFSTDFALYPEIVIFFAPVALFVGIFTQILWEEKEITSPL